jgi:photosystem II stability/assembly factor-like uncharacterized protein
MKYRSRLLTYLLIISLCFFRVILYSQDFWEQLYFPDSTAIYCIAVNDQGNIFVGAANDGVSGGVYRSIDSAQTWELVLDLGEFSIRSVVINENGDIYAGSRLTENQSALFRSNDNGQTWETIVPDIGVYGNVINILPKGDTIFVSIWSNSAVLIRSIDNGEHWEIVFQSDNSSEYVSDIDISSIGDIFISLMCFFPNMGGIYKSEDGGENWEYAGLINHQVYSVEFNSNDDLFIGVWSDFIYATGGLYAIYNGSDTIEDLLFGPSVNEMVINSDDDIYFADVPGGVIRSLDNGQTFEYVNEGLSGTIGIMSIDSQGFIYLASNSSNKLAKSIDPTITGIEAEPLISGSDYFHVFPNPASDRLTIIYKETTSHKYAEIKIFNALGIEVKQTFVSQNGKEILFDTSTLESGVYFVVMKVEGIDVATGKFLIVK